MGATPWISQDLDDAHGAAAAGAWWRGGGRRGRRFAGWRLGRVPRDRRRGIEQVPDRGELRLAMAIGEEAIMTNALEPFGKDVQQKAADELVGIKFHALLLRAVALVLPGEGDAMIIDGDDAPI